MKNVNIISAMVTPMNEDESINEKELRRQVNRQIDAGISGVFCIGTNGEAYALGLEEKEEIIRIVVDETAGRVPVYAGTGCVTTKETVKLCKRAQELGADAVSVIMPYFAAMSQNEIYNHYASINEAITIPALIYNIPARTGNSITAETVKRLAALPHIGGIKDSSGKFENIESFIQAGEGQDFTVLCGTDSLILRTLQNGGGGAISAVTNVLPELVVEIGRCFAMGDLEGAQRAQQAIQPLRDCFVYGNPNTIVKRATNLMGWPVGKTREPFTEITAEAEKAIRSAIEKNYAKYQR